MYYLWLTPLAFSKQVRLAERRHHGILPLSPSPVELSLFSPLNRSGSNSPWLPKLLISMSHPVTTVLYNQSVEEYQVLHAAALDVWVDYDGGTVIVRQGSGGHDNDADAPGNPGAPVGVPSPTETEVSV
jgi:hypothetical protein